MSKIVNPQLGIKASLHNHSVYSDGASSLEDMVKAAKNSGLQLFGISDHWVEPPYDGTDYLEWSMHHEKLDEYVENLSALKKQYDDESFQLKIGLEVDFFFENIDSVLKRLQQYPIDYLIGSVHYTGVFSVDHDIADWLPLSPQEHDQICKDYWQKVKGAAACEAFDFLGHLDLPKKFNLIDNANYFDEAVQVLETAAKHGIGIELNTSGWFKQCTEQYPSAAILQAAAAKKIPVVISSDAHCAEHITRNFNEAKAVLQAAGYVFND